MFGKLGPGGVENHCARSFWNVTRQSDSEAFVFWNLLSCENQGTSPSQHSEVSLVFHILVLLITFPFFRQYEMKIRDSELRRHNKALSHCLLTLRLSLHLKETSLHSCSKHSFKYLFGCLWYFLFYFFLILLYSTVLVLPYINMIPPRVYTCSQSWTF